MSIFTTDKRPMAETLIKPVTLKKKSESFNWCADYDDECPDVECKLTCWLYDPCRGLCPFLSSTGRDEKTTPEQNPIDIPGELVMSDIIDRMRSVHDALKKNDIGCFYKVRGVLEHAINELQDSEIEIERLRAALMSAPEPETVWPPSSNHEGELNRWSEIRNWYYKTRSLLPSIRPSKGEPNA